MSFVKTILGRIRSYLYPQWLPWILVSLAIILVSFLLILGPVQFIPLSPTSRALIMAGILAVVGLVFFLRIQIKHILNLRHDLLARTERAEQSAADFNRRLEAVFRLSQKLVESDDEKEVDELVLRLCVDLVGALGASIVPIDEHGQPMTAVNYGDLPIPVINDWVEYLASPAVRQSCGTCRDHQSLGKACPLLHNPFIGSADLYCLPLRRGDREYGVLNLYLPEGVPITEDTRDFIKAMADETAIALESIHLRRREIEALHQLKAVHNRTDLTDLLTNFIEDFREILKADYIYLELIGENSNTPSFTITFGDYPSPERSFLDGIHQAVITSTRPIILEDVGSDRDSSQFLGSIMAAPLLDQERTPLGILVCGSLKDHGFNQHHLALLKTVSAQVSLVVQNSHWMAELEYKTIMAERNRLAREIHDGLAQTLGFLKLQAAQMQNYLSQGEVGRLQQSIHTTYETLADAYQEARHAIDGLRIDSLKEGLGSWIEQTIIEFQENSGLPVELTRMHNTDNLPSEVQAQLIRIVQESLSNIRKHAQATQVWVSCYELGEDLLLEVRDNGRGFTPEDVPGPSRHGLQGMRERTELIGAEFQIISHPWDGTTVRVRLPLMRGEMVE